MSDEIWEKVLAACDQRDGTRKQIAERFGISMSRLRKILRERKKVGPVETQSPKRGNYRSSKSGSLRRQGDRAPETEKDVRGCSNLEDLSGLPEVEVSLAQSRYVDSGKEISSARNNDASELTNESPSKDVTSMNNLIRPDHVRVMIQMRSTPALAAASFGPYSAAPPLGFCCLPGVLFDASYSPVPIPPTPVAASPTVAAMTRMEAFSSSRSESTYLVRAAVQQESLSKFLDATKNDASVVGVFADPKIQAIATCPQGPIGTDADVERLLLVDELRRRGMDGTGVKVAIVDTGFNLAYLNTHGKTPNFDSTLSWGPLGGQPLGSMPVAHGTMCAYDVCIAAPRATLIDLAVLTSQTPGGSTMDGLLSDAVQAYGLLLSYLSKAAEPFAGDTTPRTLVVSNSWGMFNPSWDFPPGNPQNYSDNPDHPFNIIVASVEAAGADILFAAGNCGPECPDPRCQSATAEGIYGANSSPAVTCVAGVVLSKDRVGYSTKGPGRLDKQKPDIASFTHFAGSGVYNADGGTSAATPVAAGVVAAIRRLYPSSVISPAQLRDLIRSSAERRGNGAFNYEYGYGVINVRGLLDQLDRSGTPTSRVRPNGPPGTDNGLPVSQPMPTAVIDQRRIEKAFEDFSSATVGMNESIAAQGFDACSTWKSLRDKVTAVVEALKAVAVFLPLVGRAATVVETLSTILDQVCRPTASAVAFDPCANWKQVRPTVNGLVIALQAIAFFFPIAAGAVTVIQTLNTILDQVCK